MLSGSVSASIVGGVFTWLLDKKLDNEKRVLEMRKQIYSKLQEELTGLFSTSSPNSRKKHLDDLLVSYRQVQLWGSKAVLIAFNDFYIV